MNRFDEFAGRHLTSVLAILFYLAPLTLGLHHYDFIIRSPLVSFVAMFMGFVASVIAWIPAFLINGIVFGKFDFAKQVFKLYSNNDFAIAMALVLLTLPVARFLARTINRTASSYHHRKLLFSSAVILTIAALASSVQYMSALHNQYVYIFTCSIIGVIYFVVFSTNIENRGQR
ncbi:hypothetical protein KJ695_05350 [Patescibacteria group bacterium]|nr:hypothetical protein [Patescibacteria group bacterium]